jgi:hypothetical protein
VRSASDGGHQHQTQHIQHTAHSTQSHSRHRTSELRAQRLAAGSWQAEGFLTGGSSSAAAAAAAAGGQQQRASPVAAPSVRDTVGVAGERVVGVPVVVTTGHRACCCSGLGARGARGPGRARPRGGCVGVGRRPGGAGRGPGCRVASGGLDPSRFSLLASCLFLFLFPLLSSSLLALSTLSSSARAAALCLYL